MHATIEKSRFRWRVVDIVTAAVIGVASGVVFWAWGLAYGPISAGLAFTPGLEGVTAGGWLFAGVVAAFIVRKPGAAVFAELLAGTTEALIGNQWGIGSLGWALVQGLGVEIVLALFFYKYWSWFVAFLAGAGAGLANAILSIVIYYPAAGATVQLVYAISAIISGAVLAGLLGFGIVRLLARAGALSRFAAGQAATPRV